MSDESILSEAEEDGVDMSDVRRGMWKVLTTFVLSAVLVLVIMRLRSGEDDSFFVEIFLQPFLFACSVGIIWPVLHALQAALYKFIED